jgi:flagellar biosynthetic protein FlhB
MLIIAAFFLLVLSIPDYLFQRWQFRQSLKMTREQFKEEQKQEEGDPQVRARLRNRYKELLSRNMLNNVPKADVVITNPTHYSVALEYDRARMDAPTVIAKGEDELDNKIREIAKAHDIPVVSHPPLTRVLYRETEIGEPIPVRYYQVVISLLGHILIADKKKRKERMEA